ncbi:MAG: hypothetical protein HYU64_03005 [Armatimonadetes bacterium]|nr:hypothetical protein [Armatimonadota bacterium]
MSQDNIITPFGTIGGNKDWWKVFLGNSEAEDPEAEGQQGPQKNPMEVTDYSALAQMLSSMMGSNSALANAAAGQGGGGGGGKQIAPAGVVDPTKKTNSKNDLSSKKPETAQAVANVLNKHGGKVDFKKAAEEINQSGVKVKVEEQGKTKSLVFANGDKIVDTNGNGTLENSDVGFKDAVNEAKNKFGNLDPAALAQFGQLNSAFNDKNQVQGIDPNAQAVMNAHEDPFIPYLFSQASDIAKTKGGNAADLVSQKIGLYDQYLANERKSKEQLLGLNLYGPGARVDKGVGKHDQLMNSIQTNRDQNILPLINFMTNYVLENNPAAAA